MYVHLCSYHNKVGAFAREISVYLNNRVGNFARPNSDYVQRVITARIKRGYLRVQ